MARNEMEGNDESVRYCARYGVRKSTVVVLIINPRNPKGQYLLEHSRYKSKNSIGLFRDGYSDSSAMKIEALLLLCMSLIVRWYFRRLVTCHIPRIFGYSLFEFDILRRLIWLVLVLRTFTNLISYIILLQYINVLYPHTMTRMLTKMIGRPLNMCSLGSNVWIRLVFREYMMIMRRQIVLVSHRL